jgi:hypothetical protein
MLEVNERGKRDLDENIGEHVGGGAPSDGDGALLGEVANVARDT